jgi:hypothetical protein
VLVRIEDRIVEAEELGGLGGPWRALREMSRKPSAA